MGQPAQQQPVPGDQDEMTPEAGLRRGELPRDRPARPARSAVITGADSGIGRAVAIAYAREGADVLIAYLDEDDDAKETAQLGRGGGPQGGARSAATSPTRRTAATSIAAPVEEFGGIDVLVNNAAFQMTHESLDEIPDEEWDYTIATNIGAMFHLAKAAVPHMPPGRSIIGSSSVNSDMPSPTLAPYAATKAAIANFCASLAQMLGEKGIRVNSVAPGPIWTPLIPATMPPEKVEQFGEDVPLGRPGSRPSSRRCTCCSRRTRAATSPGARIAVTGGNPIL